MNIRPAIAEDIAAICACDHLAGEPARRRFIRDAVASGTADVAEREARVIGYAVLDYSFYGHGFIAMLYVHPAHRRAGVGAGLIRHVETRCKTAKLFTSTNERNRPMQALLVKLGYSPSGVINNLDEGDPEIVYFKRGEKLPFDRDTEEATARSSVPRKDPNR
ncbi:MAG: GNAT family N-acetyltransferase [Candidatus Eisenbacteria sp.]|nr:GNAT family N-acetyltransferase [Candidatus Eisenbacteria bacterium]